MVRWDRKVSREAVQWREVLSEPVVSVLLLFDIGRDFSGRPIRGSLFLIVVVIGVVVVIDTPVRAILCSDYDYDSRGDAGTEPAR